MTGDQMPALGWGHINVNVSDLDRSIAFYELLGFDVYRPAIPYLNLVIEGPGQPMAEGGARALGLPPGCTGRGCVMQLGRVFPKLDLIEVREGTPQRPLTNGDHGVVRICLSTRDLAGVHAHLSSQGVEFLTPPQEMQDRMAKVAVCRDPDGTLIELIHTDPENWPDLPASAGGRG